MQVFQQNRIQDKIMKTEAQQITFRMSEAGYCARALSAARLGYEPEPAPAWLQRAADEGKWHEGRVMLQLEAEGHKAYDRQQEVYLNYPKFELIGHIDGKIQYNGTGLPELLEIKSMSQFEFDRWMRQGFDGFPEYATQLSLYMAATCLHTVTYIVKNRSNGYVDRKCHGIPFEAEHYFDATINSLHAVVDCIEQNKLVDVECDMSTIRCKRCPYKQLCVPTKEEMTVQDEKVLIAAAKDYRIGKAMADEAKRLLDSAKKTFEEHTIASGQKQWRFDNLAISYVTVKEHQVPARTQAEYSYTRISDLQEEK